MVDCLTQNEIGNFELAVVSTENGISNIIAQSPDSEKTRKLTDFSTARIFSLNISADGKNIVYARGNSTKDIVLFEELSS